MIAATRSGWASGPSPSPVLCFVSAASVGAFVGRYGGAESSGWAGGGSGCPVPGRTGWPPNRVPRTLRRPQRAFYGPSQGRPLTVLRGFGSPTAEWRGVIVWCTPNGGMRSPRRCRNYGWGDAGRCRNLRWSAGSEIVKPNANRKSAEET